MPVMFAKETRTPFMHRHLYKDCMPGPILSCFSTSSLYGNMTGSNRAVTYRALDQSLRDLERCKVAHTPQEKLSRVQALLLYQIIRTFDADPTVKSTADKDMPLLRSWVDELCKVRENLGSMDTTDEMSKTKTPPKSWEVCFCCYLSHNQHD